MMKITPKNIVLIKFLLCSILPLICFSQESISLNGEWKIIFDEENEGRALDWMKVANFDQQAIQQDIVVPSCWELIKEDYEGVAFYKHEFQVPSNWDGKFIHLQFDAVNYLSEVWLNDEVVGFHEGGFTPFEFRVDEMIKTGEKNTLILRVAGPLILSEKEVDGVKKMETPQWRGGIVGGIWQDVRDW